MNRFAPRTVDISIGTHRSAGLVWALVLLALAAATALPARAQTFNVVHSFGNGSDGAYPSSVCFYGSGTPKYYFGTTGGGGSYGLGTVYKLGETESVVYSFDGATGRGANSCGSYGTTQYGGNTNNGGTLFGVTATPTVTPALYDFCSDPSCSDGGEPIGAPVVWDSVVYGTTFGGGTDNKGVLYEFNPKTGVETALHSFTGGADGSEPMAGMTEHPGISPIFYDTTSVGGANNNGTVFEFNASTGILTTLYSFGPAPDGAYPEGSGVIADSSGNLYGTTLYGGAHGYGTVYEISSSGTESVLYSFTGGADGGAPSGTLVLSAGTLYGTTTFFGSENAGGTIFELNVASGAFTVLHTFCTVSGCPDGSEPQGPMVLSGAILYGFATGGGAHGDGVVWELNLL